MRGNYFKVCLVSLLSVAAWSQVAVAQEDVQLYYDTTPGDERYGNCGDGVVEVNPYAGADVGQASDTSWNTRLWNSPWMQGSGYTKPGDYLYSINLTKGGYPAQTTWPLKVGEMCDLGPNSPVLCSNRCILINKVERTSIDQEQFLRKDIIKCYQSGDCSAGVGNGIIQPTAPYFEECDDGNIAPGDGCSPLGKIELAERFISGVCGNGVVESGEVCDDGNIRDGDGCDSRCQNAGPDPISCKGVDGGLKEQKLCGNGRVDYAFGEQCDDGENNGTPTSDCRANCVLKGSPQFDLTRYAYWPSSDSSIMMDVEKEKRDSTKPIIPEEFKGNVRVENRQQKLIIPKKSENQLSGIFYTDQEISKLEDQTYFKDGKIRFSMVVSPSEELNEAGARWDDDAFGIVFGVKGEDQDQVSDLSHYKYLMVSWRSYQPDTWPRTNILPGCKDHDDPDKSHYGTPGLRLYQVTGSPNYQQLWTMDPGCGSTDSKGSIKEIKTDDLTDWGASNNHTPGNPKGFPWAPGKTSWNRVINPFLRLNTFYAFDFGFGEGDTNQRLQIDTEFSKKELKVWVNRVLAIHVTRDHLPSDYTWPTEGGLGFYFLGMDNITVDTSGYYSYVADTKTIDKSSDQQSTTCEKYCGNGIIESDDSGYAEGCDDGNRVDGDGCSSTCQSEGESENCKATVNGAVLCYGGSITGPTDGQSVKTKNPTISGTYVGDPADILVTITNGTASCTGSVKGGEVKKNADGTWTFNKGCLLTDGNHDVTVDFVPTQSPQGTDFPTIRKTSTFTVESENGQAISLQVDQPAGDTVFIPSGASSNLPVSGSSDNADTIHIEICEEGTNTCSISKDITLVGHDSWADTLNTSSLTEGKHYTITFTAKRGAEESQSVTKNLEFTNRTLNVPVITNIKEGEQPKIIPNPDGTITVEGTEEIPDKCKVDKNSQKPEDSYFDPNICPQIYVTIQTTACKAAAGGEKKVVVKINKDGSFRGDVPLCTTATDITGTDVTINAKASDSAGNVSDHTQRTVKIVEKSAPKILITCPKSTSLAGDCLLLNAEAGKGLVVNGESNIRSERPVTVTAYTKNDEKCDFDPSALGEPVGTITTTTTAEGKWAVDFKHVKSGDYCIVAKLTTKDGKNPVNTTTANGYQRGKLDKPEFVDSAKDITEDIYQASSGTVSIRVAVDLNSNITVGDMCEVSVEANPTNWKGPGVYRLDGDQYVCDAQVPVTNPNDSNNKLVGERLVAKSVPVNDKYAKASEPSSERQLPMARILPGATDDTVNVRISKDFPGAEANKTVNFNAGTSSIPGNSCELMVDPSDSGYYVCKDEPTLTNGTDKLKEIDANTPVTASLDGRELEETVTIEGKPTITVTCPVVSVSGGQDCVKPGTTDNIVSGKTSISEVRSVNVKVYKGGDGTCDKSSTALRDKAIETGADGVWFYNPNLKGLPSGKYCVVATLRGNNDKTATIETTITYTRPSLGNNLIEFADDSQPTDIAKAVVKKDSVVPVTVKPAANDTDIIVGDECVIVVKDSDDTVIADWNAKDTFENDGKGGLICTASLKTQNGNDTLLGKTLVAKAVDQGDPSNESVAVEEAIPGKPTMSIDSSSGKAIINIDKGYPGAGEDKTIEIKIGTAKVGECEIRPQTASKLICESTGPIEKDGALLKDVAGDTIITATFTDPDDPSITSDVSHTATGKEISITCAEGSGCTDDSGGLDVTGLADVPTTEETTVKVTVYEKNKDAEQCSPSQHGTEVASASNVQVTDRRWSTSFDGLQSGEYCIVAQLLNSANDPIGSTAQVATFNRTANIDSSDTVAFVDPEQQRDNIVKGVIKGEAQVPVTVKPDNNDTNIIVGDKCIVYVDGATAWEGKGTFEKVGDKLTCTATLDIKKSDDNSLLGKKLIAKAVQRGDDTKATNPSSPLTIPGRPSVAENPDGKATITIPVGYPGFNTGDIIIFKNEKNQEVGRCSLEQVDEGLGCPSEHPLKEGDDILIDKPKGQSTKIIAFGNGVELAHGSIKGTKSAKIPGESDFDSFVSGGCSTTHSAESSLITLLLAALGFLGIRRRRP